MAALESPDGKSLYYTKQNDATALWRGRLSDMAAEAPVIQSVLARNFFVTRRGIYYMEPEGPLRFFDPESGKRQLLERVTKAPDRGLSVSPTTYSKIS
jgi:hypothetical protein